eukprot:g3479.t1
MEANKTLATSSKSTTIVPVQILVHNVTHSDLVIDCAPEKFRPKRSAVKVLHRLKEKHFKRSKFRDKRMDDSGDASQTITVRPKFNAFMRISSWLLRLVEGSSSSEEAKTALVPSTSVWRQNSTNDTATTGFVLPSCTDRYLKNSWEDYHVSDDGREIDLSERVHPKAVHFPLVASLLPTWISRVCNVHAPLGERVLVLMSGVAAPRHGGGGDGVEGQQNSTYATARLIRHFVRNFFPRVHVVHVHSDESIFRFKHNVSFINNFVKPRIQAYCRRLAASIGDAWTDFLHVCISLTDGSPARIAALNSGLREFRPDYLHILQPKSFFHSHEVDTENVCFESFAQVELRPPVSRDKLPKMAQSVVAEMTALLGQYDRDAARRNEISSFWLRKTRKPVLAVLLVDKDDGSGHKFYHGINMEVSMPTGSLCAERNCIGSALASDFGLQRKDLKMIAVLSLEKARTTMGGGRAASSPRRIRSTSSSFSEVSSAGPPPIKRRRFGTPYDEFLTTHASPKKEDTDKASDLSRAAAVEGRDSFAVAQDTLNPIKPCGACTEWLRKIAEVNPDFRILSFSDTSCEQIFIRPVPV